jgi:hypothetical protein
MKLLGFDQPSRIAVSVTEVPSPSSSSDDEEDQLQAHKPKIAFCTTNR